MYEWALLIANWIVHVCGGAVAGLVLAALVRHDPDYLWWMGAPAGVAWVALGVCFVFRHYWMRREFPRRAHR
jgi:hypothetical protein